LARAWLGLLADCARQAGLHNTDYLALIRIVAAEGMIPVELRHVLGISAGSMSDLADRLERRGFVMRIDRTDDRRSVDLRPTAEGVRTAEETIGPAVRSVLRVVRGMKAEELRVVHQFLSQTTLAVSEIDEKPPARH
jgi:DNA-binding MarR family transcriptional regulator